MQKKYANTLTDIDKQISDTASELDNMMANLYGSDADNKAIEMLRSELKKL